MALVDFSYLEPKVYKGDNITMEPLILIIDPLWKGVAYLIWDVCYSVHPSVGHSIVISFSLISWDQIEVLNSFLLNIYRIHAQNLTKFCICFDTDKLWLLPVSFLQLVTYGPWVMPIRIPFPLDIVRTNGWNFTQIYIWIYIGKILERILPVGFHNL